LLAAERGLRTIVAEVGEQSRLRALFGVGESEPGGETELQKGLWSLSIDPDRALMEWLQSLGGRVSGRVLASSSTFQYFAAAAPGAKELVSMVKIWELTQGKRWRGRGRGYDVVVLDAPATGHALGMLDSPRTFGAIARVGPIAGQARTVAEALADPARSRLVAVALPSELAVSETLELEGRVAATLGRDLDAIVVNGVWPRRLSGADVAAVAALDGGADAAVRRAVTAAAGRVRTQQGQLARLRRDAVAEVATLPFVFGERLGPEEIRAFATRLAGPQ
jgi:hypothetical protein